MTLSFKKSFSTLYSDEHLFGVHVCLHVFFFLYNEVGGGERISHLHPHPWDPHCFSRDTFREKSLFQRGSSVSDKLM